MTREQVDAAIRTLTKEGGLSYVALDTPMTLRGYFAAEAMPRVVPNHVYDPATVAEEAYALADAMLAERAK